MGETKNWLKQAKEFWSPQPIEGQDGYTRFGGLLEVRERRAFLEVEVDPELSQHNFSADRIKYIQGKTAKQIEYLFQAFTNSISPKFKLNQFPSSTSGQFNTICTLDFGDSRWRQVFEDIGPEEIFDKPRYSFVRYTNREGRSISTKTFANNFCNHRGFFDLVDSDFCLAQNKNSLFVGSYQPLMLVCMSQNQSEPFPNNYDAELLMGQDGYYTTLENMADNGYLVIFNGLGAGSIENLHLQLLSPELIAEEGIQPRNYDQVNIVTRLEALQCMDWCWSNGVYATARILGDNKWVVTALTNSQNQPISVYTQDKKQDSMVSYLDQLEGDDLIQVILAFIYNPGGFETNCYNLFSRQNAVTTYKELVTVSNWSDQIKVELIQKLDSLDSYQHVLSPMSQELIARILATEDKKLSWADSMVNLIKKARQRI